MVFRIKQYDNKTAMRAVLNSAGKPVDLTKVTNIQFLMSRRNVIVVDKPAFIVEAEAGKVWLPFEESETALTGSYKAEFVLTFNDGRRETFPDNGVITIEIVASNFALTKA